MNIRSLGFEGKKIVVVGTVFMDIKGYPEGGFIPVGRNAGRIEYKYGGVARNVAQDLAGIGCKPVFVSLADNSGPGAAIIDDLAESGVVTDYMLKAAGGIGTWMAIMTPEGDVYANLSKRQDLLALADVLDSKGNEIFSGADGILLEMDIEEEIVSRVFRLAEKYGIDVYGVISNMTIALERMEYIKKCACFICNRQEAGQFFAADTAGKNPQQILELLTNGLSSMNMKRMVVTMDKDGAAYADNSGAAGICPARKTEVVDSTGAGDSFFAGVSAGLINGMSLEESCSLGTELAYHVIRSTENTYRG